MAKKADNVNAPDPSKRHRRTSIGNSANTRPTNKHKKKSFKRSRGQGR